MKPEFEKAYDEYAEPIFRHCYMRLHDRERAKELMQEAFLKTWQYMEEGKEIGNIRAFLYRTAHNMVINEWRKKSVTSLDTMAEEEGFDPESGEDKKTMEDEIDAKAVLEKVKELDEKYREVIVMRYVDELSVKEISSILDESENVISVRIHRALKQLRTILEKHEQGI